MQVGVIILAGGKSSRMGTDKGLMLINGKPMLQHIIVAVAAISNNIIIVSNKSAYQQFGCPVVKDEVKNAGPLAGIFSGLKFANTAKNIVLSCDVPFVNEQLVSFLIENSKNFDVTIAQKDEQLHPLIGVYSKKCLPIFEKELMQQQFKVRLALQKVKLNIVNVNQFEAAHFININTPTDLKTATL